MAEQRGDEAQREERMRLEWELYKAGAPCRDIAAQLTRQGTFGTISKSQVHRDIQEIFETLQADLSEDVRQHRTLDLARIDSAITALNRAVKSGDPEAIRVLDRLINTRAKLLGTFAPEKREHAGPNGGAIPFRAIMEVPTPSPSVEDWEKENASTSEGGAARGAVVSDSLNTSGGITS